MIAELLGVSPEWSANFLLVLARLSAAIVAVPLLGARGVPPQAKIGLALLLSLIVLPLHQGPIAPIPTNLFVLASLIGSEVLVGLAIGIAVALVFHALEMGATLIGVQMGFGFAGLLDPIAGEQTSILNQFYKVLVTLVFFAMNGHHLVIGGLLHTFEVVPPGSADMTVIAGERVIPFFSALFVVSLRIALPAMAALLLTDLALGLVSRTVPQMNALIVGLPLKVGVGLLVIAASVPMLTAFMGAVFGEALLETNGFLRP